MSDAKSINLSSLVSKKTRRAKERLLQNFGKADRTTDEIFEVYQFNFIRQQNSALNLQKHIRHYLTCLRELHEASKALNSCLLVIHEKEWPKHDVIENNIYETNNINEDLEEKLKESVLVPLEQYLGQFPDVREKISKRGRKLVDYDSIRHSFETSKQHNPNGKQSDDAKVTKHRDQLEDARRIYESLNNELYDELPALYDNRISFMVTMFQNLFNTQMTFYNDNLNIQKDYLEAVQQLAKAVERGELDTIKPIAHITKAQISSSSPTSSSGNSKDKLTQLYPSFSESQNGCEDKQTNFSCKQVPNNGKQPIHLHKVEATYPYLAEDEDELSFEAGEIIQVIEYDDPSEQEEGWLKGIKEGGQKGLFPANFTKKI